MKTHVASLAKGINCVSDKALIEPGFATCLDNIDIRSGSIRPFHAPRQIRSLGVGKINHLSCAGVDAIDIYWSRGLFILSSLPRDYTSEYVGESDRIFFTEYGSIAQKIVSGIQVPLGLRRPTVKPSASVMSDLGIRGFKAVEQVGGNITKDTTKSYRIALSTDDGILPPTNKVIVKASAANVSNMLTWNRTIFSDMPVRDIIIFAGDEDKEKRIATVPASQTYFLDDGSISISGGELALTYDLDLDFTYCYTFVRNVRGMEDESGPSPLSIAIKSNNARRVNISASTDGLFDSSNLVTSVNPGVQVRKLDTHSEITGWSITGFSTDVDTGMVKVSIACTPGDFSLATGRFVRFMNTTGVSPDKAYEIYLEPDHELENERLLDPLWTSRNYFFVDAPITTGQAIATQTVASFQTATIASVGVDTKTSAVIVTTTVDHCFYTGQKITFPDKDGTVYDAVTNPIDRTKIVISGGTFDRLISMGGYGTSIVGHGAFISGLTSSNSPHDGDAVDLSLFADPAHPEAGVVGLFRARTGGKGGLIVDIVLSSDIATTHSSSYIKFVPNNDYIYARRLYRVGDTGEFLKVKDLEPWVTTTIEARPTIALGAPITSNYNSNGIDVTFDVPPTGMNGITSHYDMKFAIYGNTVRWTENGYPDAWAEQFSQDFKYRPLALVSYGQSLLVFCEDAVYELVGNTATSMSISITSAVDGCIAPGSVQATNEGVFYLSKRGIMLYKGGGSECITDTRISPGILLGTSDRGGIDIGYDFFWYLSRHHYLYRNFAKSDQPLPYLDGDPGPLEDTEPIPGVIQEIGSFYVGGRYYLYWSSAPSINRIGTYHAIDGVTKNNYAMHTTLCIDTYSQGFPITTMGFKPRDVFVTENEEVFFLADGTGDEIGGGL